MSQVKMVSGYNIQSLDFWFFSFYTYAFYHPMCRRVGSKKEAFDYLSGSTMIVSCHRTGSFYTRAIVQKRDDSLLPLTCHTMVSFTSILCQTPHYLPHYTVFRPWNLASSPLPYTLTHLNHKDSSCSLASTIEKKIIV